ncbi:hypothetical protein B4N89_44380 [Embleya scabrispora]|uniref:Uncharacterized protein n=1 Tax=Embleya scabrispora TaxID=159449 RepID=A0A1T3NLJ1_9ACTN|nr:hypothetical protein [Embleya scabrispora]OPC77531.1 hypothetical protein B4N89_44380 [Embleya scabrispora]
MFEHDAPATPRAASRTRRRPWRVLVVTVCAVALLASSTACGGGDDTKAAAAPPASAGPQTPGSTPPATNTGAATPTAPASSSSVRPCVPVTATDKPARGTLTRDDLRFASRDPRPVTGDEVFGLAQLPYKYAGGTLTRACVKTVDDCTAVADDDATAARIGRLGCERGVVALYVDKANNVQTTVGVLQMPTAVAAATLAESKDDHYKQVGPPVGSGVEDFEPDAPYSWTGESLYRYFIYEMTGRADGGKREAGEVARHIAAQNAVYHLVGDSLDRRSDGVAS